LPSIAPCGNLGGVVSRFCIATDLPTPQIRQKRCLEMIAQTTANLEHARQSFPLRTRCRAALMHQASDLIELPADRTY